MAVEESSERVDIRKDRMERTGMRWLQCTSQAMLDLRATYLNGEWNAFWSLHLTLEVQWLYAEYGKLEDANGVFSRESSTSTTASRSWRWLLTYFDRRAAPRRRRGGQAVLRQLPG